MNAYPFVALLPTMLIATVPACSSSSTSSAGADGGTSPGTTIEASSYDQSCTADAQCVGVYSGEACTACHCPNDAVSSAAATKYQNDLAAKEASCTSKGVCTVACTMPAVHCVAGKCKSG